MSQGLSDDPQHLPLELHLLGPLEVRRGPKRVPLPRSKKARALLAYLAMSGREHNRQRLCTLLWDVTDDPRGALRWSLSKLRRVVDEDGAERIVADRHSVRFSAQGARVDVLLLLEATSGDLSAATTDELEQLAALAQGELLEGFELPDFLEFQAWLVAAREQARRARCEVLTELLARLADEPQRALPHAHARVQADPLSVPARVALLELLVRTGKREEASQQLDVAGRLLREVGAPGVAQLQEAWRVLCTTPPRNSDHPPVAAQQPAQAPQVPRATPVAAAQNTAFVGRQAERAALIELLPAGAAGGTQRVALVTADPGAGKSRLALEMILEARARGLEVLRGRAYEAESTRPYGPWVDALGERLPQLGTGTGDGAPANRDALFSAVAAALGEASSKGALLVLDDIQWMDRDSAELLHFAVRTTPELPLTVLLLARSGELPDNEAAMRALRGVRREAPLLELELPPLSAHEVAALVDLEPDAAAAIFDASAGNPLYALELSRARAAGIDHAPSSLVQLVRERIERLPARAAEILRWAAVLGHSVDVARLQTLSTVQPGELLDALEHLERHTLLRGDTGQPGARYVFAHDVLRAAVYSELSQPRRRLMHQQVARILQPRATEPAIATEVAHHATLAGNAQLGVQACVAAARHSLRLCANADAEALAKRGLSLVDDLEALQRVTSTLELLQVQYAAATPDRQQAAERVQKLAEQALDLGSSRGARLGFQMLSYLRWESSRMADAHDHIMKAERISRSADPAERSAALAQAAKCLVLLERDMGQAEAFALEAQSLSVRGNNLSSAVAFATGMLHAHRGEAEPARASFREARELGREAGDRLAEFGALENWMMLEFDEGHRATALELAHPLALLGARVREGAEGPSGRALLALARRACGEQDADGSLDAAMRQLVVEDAKYELSFLLTRLAALELSQDATEDARVHAQQGLECATALGRKSEIAIARALLVRCARASASSDEQHLAALAQLRSADLSSGARRQLEDVLGRE